jgi:hypothetical protein
LACQLLAAAVLLVGIRPHAARADDIPVPGGRDVVANMLGIRPAPDAPRFVSELVRILYALPEDRDADAVGNIARFQAALPAITGESETVPVPLSLAFWNRILHRGDVPAPALLAAILSDRSAALLCYGLAGLDDETLQFVGDHPQLAERLYRRAGVFAAFAGSLHVHDGRVAAPGGTRAQPWWEAAIGKPLADPEAFIAAWLEKKEGRVAYLYNVIDSLGASGAAFALGAWMDDARAGERFAALVDATDQAAKAWEIDRLPFARQQFDVAALLWRVRADAAGAPAPPARRDFWAQASAGDDLRARADLRDADGTPFDAAWLVRLMFAFDGRERQARFGALTFAQRALGAASPSQAADALVAVRGYLRFPYLMLALERMGVRSPALYAAAARRADAIDGLDPTRAFAALGQFQGSLAILSRLVRVRAIDARRAEPLASELVALDFTDGWYAGRVAAWLTDRVVPLLEPAYDTEHTLIGGLAGAATPDGTEHRVTWEGQQYRLDLGQAERRRLEQVRDRQGAEPIDAALGVARVARRLASGAADPAAVAASIADLQQFAEDVERNPSRGITPDRVGLPDAAAAIRDAAAELSRLGPRDMARTARFAGPLARAGDVLLSQSLVSIVYALYIGDPDGTVLLAGDVSRRHDFGFASGDPGGWTRTAWNAPREQVSPGVPWHVSGPVLALDTALGALILRRINTERVMPAPVITMNERDTITDGVALMDPLRLTDADRDRIAAAVSAGRARLQALDGTGEVWQAMADEVHLDGWRRRAAAWLIAHDRSALPDLFSLEEFLEWGGAAPGDLDAWGTSGSQADACLCLELVPSFQWHLRAGRPPLGLLSTVVADLNLHVALALDELRLPAALGQDVLRAAAQDFVDEVRPTDPDDWLSLVRGARAASRERIEDYVAASAAVGPLVPAEP